MSAAGSPGSRLARGLLALVAVGGGAVFVERTFDPPSAVSSEEVDGRTWLSTAGLTGRIVLANGISGLVEAQATLAEGDDVPTGLHFGGSTRRYTMLRNGAALVVVADGSHHASVVDTVAASTSVLGAAGVVSTSDVVRARPITREDGRVEVGEPAIVDAAPPVAGISPIVDRAGDVWVLVGEQADTVLRVGAGGGVRERVSVDAGARGLLAVDGEPFVRYDEAVVAVAGDDHRRGGDVVPSVAASTDGRWTVATGAAVTIDEADGPDDVDTVEAPGPVSSLAIWHGAVWSVADARVARLDGEGVELVPAARGPFDVFTDGGRLWFVSETEAVSIDRHQHPTVFRFASVDVDLCVSTCEPDDVIQRAAQAPDASSTTAPERGSTTTAAPMTLPSNLPTTAATTSTTTTSTTTTSTTPPATTTPATVPPAPPSTAAPTTVPATAATRPPTTSGPPPSSSTTSTVPRASTTTAPPPTSSAAPARTTVPATTAPPRPGGGPPDSRPNPTEPAETSPPWTAAPPTQPPSSLPPTTAAPSPAELVLEWADGGGDTGATEVTVNVGWRAQRARDCGGNSIPAVVSVSGAEREDRPLTLRRNEVASVTFVVRGTGTLSAGLNVCGRQAYISRNIVRRAPALTGVTLTPQRIQIGETFTATATYDVGDGWEVSGVGWQGGRCGTELLQLSATWDQTSSSFQLPTSDGVLLAGPGRYCVRVTVMFRSLVGARQIRLDGSAEAEATPATTTTTTTTTSTTSVPPTTTTTTTTSTTTTSSSTAPPPSTGPPASSEPGGTSTSTPTTSSTTPSGSTTTHPTTSSTTTTAPTQPTTSDPTPTTSTTTTSSTTTTTTSA